MHMQKFCCQLKTSAQPGLWKRHFLVHKIPHTKEDSSAHFTQLCHHSYLLALQRNECKVKPSCSVNRDLYNYCCATCGQLVMLLQSPVTSLYFLILLQRLLTSTLYGSKTNTLWFIVLFTMSNKVPGVIRKAKKTGIDSSIWETEADVLYSATASSVFKPAILLVVLGSGW